MVDEAEEGAESTTEEEYRLRIREVRMTLINFAKGCHPCLSVLGDVFVCLSHSISGFPSGLLLEWWFCLAPGMRRCRCDTLAGEGFKRQVII